MKLPRDEFEKLAIEQMDAVDRVARTLTRNGAEADDLVQETFLRAFRASDTFELQSFGIRPWLLRPVYERLQAGHGEFLAELRPAIPMFLRFGGIDFERDRRRDQKAAVQGFTLIRVTYRPLMQRPWEVAEVLDRLLGTRQPPAA